MSIGDALEATRLRRSEPRTSLARSPLVLASLPDEPYTEEAFHYFLRMERKRVERSRCPFLLLLIRLAGHGGRMDSRAARSVMDGLSLCIRDVDFAGWYRNGRILGAVLTRAGSVPPEARLRIRDRAVDTLADHLPSRVAQRLKIRVLQVRHGDGN